MKYETRHWPRSPRAVTHCIRKFSVAVPPRFGAAPNQHTCPVCLGLPGVLPVLNKKVVDFALRAALATHCTIAPASRWARKNYFYPDLPKGYQISMYELPIAEHGYVEVTLQEQAKKVRLTRIHMEEDAGKSIHDAEAGASLVDLNRTGVPLLEIVSEPDIRSAAEAAVICAACVPLLQYIEVCVTAIWKKAACVATLTCPIRPQGQTEFGTRTETKNLNSFRAVEKAIEHEIQRQTEVVEAGGAGRPGNPIVGLPTGKSPGPCAARNSPTITAISPTRIYCPWSWTTPGWNTSGPDLPELPATRRARFMHDYGLPAYDAEVLTARKDVADYFEASVRACPTAA